MCVCDAFMQLCVRFNRVTNSNCSGMERVWTMSPVFRAENARSTRHLAEFYMVEAEIAFAYDIRKILDVMEKLIKAVINSVLTKHEEEWNFFMSLGNKEETENRKVSFRVFKLLLIGSNAKASFCCVSCSRCSCRK